MFFRSLALAVLVFLTSLPVVNGQVFRGRGNNNTYRPPVQQQNPPQAQNPGNFQVQPVQPAQQIQGTQTSGTTSTPRVHWSQQILEGVSRDHDFGAVAKASNQVHIFEFENTLDTPLTITGARTSCGCTKVRVLTNEVKPGEKGQIEARYDTVAFAGARSATVSVGVSKRQPYSEYSELRFSVKGMIRTDVVFEPGTMDFGPVSRGNSVERSVIVKYAGRQDWQVESAVSSNPNMTVEIKETMRDRNRGRTDYQITLKLNGNAPNGRINDVLTVKTNDRSNDTLTLPISGSVESMITAADVNLGMIEKGKTHEKRLIVSGKEPFEILEIHSENSRLEFPSKMDGSKTLHIIVFKFDAAKEGLVSDDIVIRTNNETQPEIRVNFRAQVIAATIVGD
jgi:hypothetical protein